MILLDTNLLARITDSTNPQCAVARRAIHILLAKRERLVIVPQNFYEFWAVATRKRGAPPAGQNGLSMTPEQASQTFQASVARIREYAKSLKELTVGEVRKKLEGGKIREEDWKSGQFGGKSLIATYPEYEVRVMFSGRDGEALIAEVTISSK